MLSPAGAGGYEAPLLYGRLMAASAATFMIGGNGYGQPVHTRVTGICVEAGRILLLDQDTDGPRRWSLPGGKVEHGETLAGALVREMAEETGVEVEVGRLLYLCDHVGAHVVHITFEVRRVGGRVGAVAEGADTRPIREVRFVELTELPELGFGERFVELAQAGWPQAGSYMGAKANIGL